MTSESLPRRYFETLYERDPDPWRFRSSDYEKDKYADTVQALDGRRFRRGIEVGCSIGILTGELAHHCDWLLGVDIAEAPLASARRHNAKHQNLSFERMALPAETPPGRFDLIVLSEVLYYLVAADIHAVARWATAALEPDGMIVLVHWLGETPDYPLTGDEACAAFIEASAPGLTIDRHWRREQYRVDRLKPGDAAR